jgi:hypothetical protein
LNEPALAGMAELADAADSKSADRKVVGVRPPLPAPTKKKGLQEKRPALTGDHFHLVHVLVHVVLFNACGRLIGSSDALDYILLVLW